MPSLTINYNAQDGATVAAALGKIQGWTNGGGAPRSATEAEVKQALIGVMKGWVRTVKTQEAQALIQITDVDLT